ncbi:MAG TPA: hypothetical protein VEG44_06230 [Candidatus Acidoferrales bacterium]|nr:hypothetical protein [Candidatus Acidoferrales bacterium]
MISGVITEIQATLIISVIILGTTFEIYLQNSTRVRVTIQNISVDIDLNDVVILEDLQLYDLFEWDKLIPFPEAQAILDAFKKNAFLIRSIEHYREIEAINPQKMLFA